MTKSDIAAGPQYHLRMFRHGTCRITGRYAYRHYAKTCDHRFDIYVGIVQGAGLTALVDTGMESVEVMNRGAGFLMTELITQSPGQDTQSILASAGVAPEGVDYVLLTHCHYDHCSQLPLFERARVVIPATAWRVWHDTPDGAQYLHSGFLDYLHLVETQGRLLLLDEGIVVPGIGVRRVGGHSPCSQFVYVNTARGVVALTGDTVQMYANLEQNDTVGIWMDGWECRRALKTARTTADVVVPGHDPRVFEEFENGVVA